MRTGTPGRTDRDGDRESLGDGVHRYLASETWRHRELATPWLSLSLALCPQREMGDFPGPLPTLPYKAGHFWTKGPCPGLPS